MNTKYIFLDVDGTLVNFESEIPPSTVIALKKAQENGHKVIICTGRQKSQIYDELLDAVKFDGIIACSGAYIEKDGVLISSSRPDPEKFSFLIDLFHEYDIPYCIQTARTVITEEPYYPRMIAYSVERGSSQALIDSIFHKVEYTTDPKGCQEVEKVAFYGSPLSREELSDILGDYYQIVGYSLGAQKYSSKHHGEITFGGINKAVGIEIFMKHSGAPVSDAIAVGDSDNDIEMLSYAGIGVAMGNASQNVKDLSDLVTTDIDDNGIYNAFVKLGIIS